MRTKAALVVLFMLAVPTALAQDLPPAPSTDPTATLTEFSGEAVPNGATATATFTMTVPCTVLITAGGSANYEFAATTVPPWALVTLAAPTGTLEPAACNEGTFTMTSAVTATATTMGPAFMPGDVTITGTVSGEQGDPVSAADTKPLTAGFFSRLVATAGNSALSAKPGEALEFAFTIRNEGNADTALTFTVDSADAGLQIDAPGDDAVGTLAKGGTNTVNIAVPVDAPSAAGTYSFAIAYAGALATDATMAGDSGSVTFAIEVQAPADGGGDGGNDSPGPGLVLVLVAVGLGVALRRRIA